MNKKQKVTQLKKYFIFFIMFSRSVGINCFLLIILMFSFNCFAQPAKQWDKRYGGSSSDYLEALQQTTDGGYILGGYSNSDSSGDKTQTRWGFSNDYWIVKTDANGNKQWDKRFGGSDNETLYALQQTTDGGYILGGFSLSGISGDKTQASQGDYDYWIVKTDANGNKQWDKRFGGNNKDFLTVLQQTNDGGYILGGYSLSGISGDKTQASQGDHDYWIVKIDANGSKQWDKRFGGKNNETLYALQQTTDGGYILGGSSNSGISGDKTQTNKGFWTYWLVKVDSSGNKQWDKCFGGNKRDELYALQQTTDGGYILGGSSTSGISGDKTENNRDTTGITADYWIVKIDSSGNKQWDKRFGGDVADELSVIQQTTDSGYILGGYSDSGAGGDRTEKNKGSYADYWLVKTDANGSKQWDKCFGGSGADRATALQQTTDESYILGGRSNSRISGDRTEENWGSSDYWIVKTTIDIVLNNLYVNLGKDTSFCQGNTLQLDAGNSGAAYVWQDSSINQTFTVTTSGIYSVEVADTNGFTASDTILITVYSLPAIELGNDITLCTGMDTVLNAGGNYSTYYWSTNENTPTITVSPTSTITYTVTATDTNGCTAIDSATVTVGLSLITVTGDDTICKGQSATLTASGGTSYLWNTSETTNSITVSPTITTTYTVTATDNNGCTATNNKTVIINTCSGIDEQFSKSNSPFVVFPNPSDGNFELRFTNYELGITNAEIKIYNVLGEAVYQQTLNTKQKTLNTKLMKGVYLLQMTTDEGVFIDMLIKK